MIRKATWRDIDKIELLYREILSYEAKNGSFSNWVMDVYPTRQTAVDGFLEDNLYVLEENGEICGSIILNHIQPDVYGKIDWKYSSDNKEDFLVIHTLSVAPSKAGKGYGAKLVNFAFDKAEEMGCVSVRLDTFADNIPAATLYRNCGFRYVGTAFSILNGVIPEMQIFFEKEIIGIKAKRPLTAVS